MSWIGKNHMRTVPIVLGFDCTQVVGSATIDLSLVPQDTNWCLSIGSRSYGPKEKLVCFGLIPDGNYRAYLNMQASKEGI